MVVPSAAAVKLHWGGDLGYTVDMIGCKCNRRMYSKLSFNGHSE